MSKLRQRLKEQKTNLRGIPNSRFIDTWDAEWRLKPIEVKGR